MRERAAGDAPAARAASAPGNAAATLRWATRRWARSNSVERAGRGRCPPARPAGPASARTARSADDAPGTRAVSSRVAGASTAMPGRASARPVAKPLRGLDADDRAAPTRTAVAADRSASSRTASFSVVRTIAAAAACARPSNALDVARREAVMIAETPSCRPAASRRRERRRRSARAARCRRRRTRGDSAARRPDRGRPQSCAARRARGSR